MVRQAGREHRGLHFIDHEDVDEPEEALLKRTDGGGVEQCWDASGAGAAQRFFDDIKGRLELRHEDAGERDTPGQIEVVRRHVEVRGRRGEDRVLSAGDDDRDGETRLPGRGTDHAAAINSFLFGKSQQDGSKRIVGHPAKENSRRTEPRRGNGLVQTLATGEEAPASGEQCLTGHGEAVDVEDDIERDAAEDADCRLERHMRSLTLTGAGGEREAVAGLGTYDWRMDGDAGTTGFHLVDGDGEPRGRYCPDCGLPLTTGLRGGRERLLCACGFVRYRNPAVGVAVVVRDAGAGVLLGRRAKGDYAGLWCIPCGYVEWGEDVRDAARREFLEETGLHVDLGEVLAVHSNFHNPKQYTVGVWFRGEITGGALHPADGEHSALGYHHPLQPPPLAFPTDALVLSDLAQRMIPGPGQ